MNIYLEKIAYRVHYYTVGLFRKIDEENVFLNASALTFNILTCILPTILILFSVLGMFLSTATVQQRIISFIDTTIPYQSASQYIKNIVNERMHEFIQYKGIAGIIGLFGLFFTASSLFSTLSTILNKIYNVQKKKNALAAKVRDFFMIIVVLVFTFLSVTVVPVINVIMSVSSQIPLLNFIHISYLTKLIFSLASFIIIFILFYFIYTYLPYQKIQRRVRILSAITAVILWEVAKKVFGYYLYEFATFNKIYGTYAVFVVVIFWVYYSCVLLIISAAIGQLYRERLIRHRVF